MSRPRGGYIGHNAAPAAVAINSAASGAWTLREAEALKRAGTWPTSFLDPTQIAGLQLWLDAAAPETLFDATTGGSLVAADGGVARWQDKSGNGRHATQSTSANRPARKTAIQGGLDVLRFDGSNDSLTISDFLELSTGQAITALVVIKRGVTGSTHTIVSKFNQQGSQYSEDGWAFRFLNTNTLNVVYAQDGEYTNQTSSSSVSASTFSVLAFKATAGSLTTSTVLYQNGIALASSNSGSVQSLDDTNYNVAIGRLPYDGNNFDFLNGDIAEIIIYNSALSNANRSLVESYLMSKWGIA